MYVEWKKSWSKKKMTMKKNPLSTKVHYSVIWQLFHKIKYVFQFSTRSDERNFSSSYAFYKSCQRNGYVVVSIETYSHIAFFSNTTSFWLQYFNFKWKKWIKLHLCYSSGYFMPFIKAEFGCILVMACQNWVSCK